MLRLEGGRLNLCPFLTSPNCRTALLQIRTYKCQFLFALLGRCMQQALGDYLCTESGMLTVQVRALVDGAAH